MTSSEPARLIPTGNCWCGCGKEAGIGAFFARGHDKIAEAALLAAEFQGSVPHLLHSHGYGPGHSVTDAAVRNGRWERCQHKACPYAGTPASVRSHKAKYH